MSRRKLISFLVSLDVQDNVAVSLLKDVDHYLIKTEYYHAGDKIKETNNEIEREVVYRLFFDLEAVEFEKSDNSDSLASLKVYYSRQDYLEQEITEELLKSSSELSDVVRCLVGFVDGTVDKSRFGIEQLK